MKLKDYRLTAWMEGHPGLPLYTCDVQALDEEDARRHARLPDWEPRLKVTVPVTWDVAEVLARPNGSVLVPTDKLARIKDQRDRALALLRDFPGVAPRSWWASVKELLAEVGL